MLPKLGENINLQIQEAQLAVRRINTYKTTSWNIIIKLLKDKNKEKLLKASREKWHIMCRGIVYN